MASVATVNDTFVANLTALYHADPRLAHRIDALLADAGPATEPSRAGPPTARIVAPDGRHLYLHSRYDPVDEAERFCKAVEQSDALCAVLCGMGLGYHARALLDDLGPEGLVIVGEPDLATLKTALEHTPLAEAIATGRIVFLTSLNKHELHGRLSSRAPLLMLGTRYVVPPPARAINAEFHAQLRAALNDFAAFCRMSLCTLVVNSRTTCDNVACNLPAYLASPSIEPLAGLFGGYPAFIVSAGPSLARNVEQLRRAAGRAVIIAVQTTFKPLLQRGIRPDFVTTLDYSDLSRRFFDGIDDFGGAILVAEPKAASSVIDAFRGGRGPGARPVLMLHNEFAQRAAGAELAARAGLRAGSTVAHLAFYLAEHLGCDPIVLVGQDLGFSGGVYYPPGVAIHDAWLPELGRFCSLEQKEWERIVRNRAILRRMTDVDGRPIYTDDQMFTYLEQFERDFAASRARVFDATEGGVAKRGAAPIRLAEAIERFCTRPIPDDVRQRLDAVRSYDADRVAAGRAALAERRGQLDRFRDLCTQTRDVLDELRAALADAARFNRLIVRVDELRSRVRDHDRLFRMVSDVSQLAELQKFFADRRLAADGATGRERTIRQLERDRRFIAALLDGCDALEKILDRSIARFDEERKAAARP